MCGKMSEMWWVKVPAVSIVPGQTVDNEEKMKKAPFPSLNMTDMLYWTFHHQLICFWLVESLFLLLKSGKSFLLVVVSLRCVSVKVQNDECAVQDTSTLFSRKITGEKPLCAHLKAECQMFACVQDVTSQLVWKPIIAKFKSYVSVVSNAWVFQLKTGNGFFSDKKRRQHFGYL